MKRIAALISMSVALASPARAAVFNVDGTWWSPTGGYATQIEPDDQSGSTVGETVTFSSAAFPFPHPMSVYIDTPKFGNIVLNFTTINNFYNNQAGVFWSMSGIDSAGGYDLMTAIIAPAHGVFGFEVEGYGFSPIVVPPPPYVPPPPCLNCAPPPPCVNCDPPPPCLNCGPPIIPTVPETSTWMMMLVGFASLAGLYSRNKVAS